MKLQQCRPFDSRFLSADLTDRQKEIYLAYGTNGSSVNKAARILGTDPGTVSKAVRAVQDKAHKHFGTDVWDDDVEEIVQKPMKVLFFDIETAPNIAYTYPLYNVNLGHKAIIRYGYVLSFAARWMGTDKVIFKRCTDGDDYEVVKALIELFDKADIVVGHNGKAFDVDTIKGKALKHGLQPPSPFKVADTMRFAKYEFRLERNSLEFLADYLGCTPKQDHTEFPGQQLFWACDYYNDKITAKERKRAWSILKEYNIGDIDTLEEVYYALRPWASRHPNIAVFMDTKKSACPKCGSYELEAVNPIRTNTMVYPGFRCKNCGGLSRGRHNISEKEVKKATLVNAV